MKKHQILSRIFFAAAAVLTVLTLIFVSYEWGYMQSAIDRHTAAFSAPAYLSVVTGIPFFLGAAVSAVLGLVFYRNGKKDTKK